MSNLSEIEAMAHLETLYPENEDRKNMHHYTGYIEMWKSHPHNERILNFETICHHCWILILRGHLHQMGLKTEMMSTAFHDHPIGQTNVSHDVKKSWTSNVNPAGNEKYHHTMGNHTSRQEIRMRIWGWEEMEWVS